MKKYKNKCGLTKQEFELERLVDAVRNEPSTLICIKILERGFKKLNTPRVSKRFSCSDFAIGILFALMLYTILLAAVL